MKTSKCGLPRAVKLAPGLLPLLLVASLAAQNDPSLPPPTNAVGVVVTLHASDSLASEAGPNSGAFTVRRTGSTNASLLVFFELGGIAENGRDYQGIESPVVIPEGASLARVPVTPLPDSLVEGNETVIARLTPSPLVGPLAGYEIGFPSNAVVTIADADRPVETNRPPWVGLVSPPDGAVFAGGVPIYLAAHATDFDGHIVTVAFFANANLLAVTTNNPLTMNVINPFQFVWIDAPAGEHVLTARATDNGGLTGTSQPVRIKVGPALEPIVVNVHATDSVATEIPEVPPDQDRPQLHDPAVFTFTRMGNTNIDLPVFYRLGGTASNGVDYAELTGRLTIPAGRHAARLEVSPMDDLLVEGPESVVVAVEAPACIAIFPPPPECYRVGENGRAEAVIMDDDLKTTNNVPPTVRITAPLTGATFPAGADIAIHAVTVDPDGYASSVEFFANTTKIGEATIFFVREPDPGTPIEFDFLWQNAPAGSHALTVRTRDNDGAPATSLPIWIRVGEPCDRDVVLPARATGTIRFLPDLGGHLDTPVGTDIQSAYGRTTEVNREFRRGFMEFAVPRFSTPILRARFVLTESRAWTSTPLPPDRHELGFYPADLAVGTNDYAQPVTLLETFATDANEPQKRFEFDVTELLSRFQGENLGFRVKLEVDPDYTEAGFLGSGFLAPQIMVSFCTNVPPPPPTNLVPVVTVVARDAIAAEGTNCWWLNANAWLDGWARWGVNFGGANTATFVVSRSGGTNEPLTVYYSLRGSASNGIDYVELPGAVTIPAGRRSARIELRPLDDLLAEGMETVVVTLENDVVIAPTNTDPAIGTPIEFVPMVRYVPGYPRRAAALIVDNDRPRPPCLKLRDGPFHFCLPATNGFCHRIEVSTNLVHWTPVCTNVVTDGALHFVDPDAAADGVRFYRAIPELALPAED